MNHPQLSHADRPGTAARSRDYVWEWAVGLLVSVVALGPALLPGSLLNLDFVLLPEPPVPSGVWGLGPGLPRRVPLMVPFSWLGSLGLAVPATKMLLLASLTSAFVGASRLARPVPLPWRLGAGVLFALSPFSLTRLGVGHIFILVTMGLLPWAIGTLFRPGQDVNRTFLWTAALALTGALGGSVAAVCVAVGLLVDRPRNWLRVVVLVGLAQLPWLVPTAVVASQGANLSGAAAFSTAVESLGDGLRVLAGHGFWQPSFQIGASDGAWPILAGVALLVLGFIGHKHLGGETSRQFAVAATLGLCLALASGIPVGNSLHEALASTPVGAPFRESQRALVLYLVWLAPAATLGAYVVSLRVRWYSTAVLALPLALGLVLASPGLWGAGGQLDPTDLPEDWHTARDIVREDGGTVLVLPWAQYLDLAVADGRRTLNPMPMFLGGDAVSSSNPQLGEGTREKNDPRETRATELIIAALRGDSPAEGLAEIGVRWVVLMHEDDWEVYDAALAADPGLDPVLEGEAVSLYEVVGWRGYVVTADGSALDIDPVVTPLQMLEGSEAATWSRPWAPGWLRGTQATHRTDAGLVGLPEGAGIVWYWPAFICLGAYFATGFLVLKAARATLRDR